ncbi:glycosyltransferase [Thiorhodococcus minor]|uniref:Glycosyltransferase n=1 Tax=Thiorhodococcus minor TaxID=57489 RepID=A0A6M0K1P8_9GAMM|nr:glycosyltransferase [Thiorhodococcus minor]NEV62823.1 glycosyltransferase [Thiorhodococcus minor]
MRVLHIGKYFPPVAGGIEHFLADLAGAQSRAGIEVAALVHSAPGPKIDPDATSDSPIRVFRAPSFGQVLYAPVSPGFPIWLKRAIAELRPDLLHLHLPNTSALLALAIPAARRLPWVVHWHSDVVPSLIDRRLAAAYRLYRPFERMLLERSRAIIATSPTYLQASEALQPWQERCTVIPLGLDRERVTRPPANLVAEADRLWGKAELRVLTIGRLTYYKGHEYLIRAIAGLELSRLLIVGAGELRPQLEALVRSQGLNERVRLLGYQPQDRLSALLETSDVVCLPSIERTEAFGLVQLEAMHFAKPVVVSDILGSGTGWVVRLAQNGLLAEPRNVDALRACLARLRDDRELRQRLGLTGTMALDRELGLDSIVQRVSEVYQRVLR